MFSDDIVGDVDFDGVSPRGHVRELAEHAVPARISASWLDGATAQGALARWNALPNVPMQLSLGATTHLGGLHADPFAREAFAPAPITPEVQFGADVAFVKKTLAGEKLERKIDYYVLGAGTWRSTTVWPPRGVHDQLLHFSARGLEARAAGLGRALVPCRPDDQLGRAQSLGEPNQHADLLRR